MDRITASKVFINIVDLGSMAAAADALDMSRSMVTRYLVEMENWAGTRLLHRSTRRLGLTNTGEKILNQCRELVCLAEELATSSEIIDDKPSGLLRISCAQFMAQEVIGPFVGNFLRSNPNVSIDLHISNQKVNLVEERIDLAVRVTNDLDPNLIARPLGQLNSVLCATADYLTKNGQPQNIGQLTQHNCLTYTYFGKSLWRFKHNNEVVTAAVAGNFSANESMVLLNAALSGAGITLQPKHAVAKYLADSKLIELLPDYLPDSLGIYGIYRSRKHMSLALRTLIDDLVNYITSCDL